MVKDGSNSTEEDSRENTIQTHEQIEAVDNEDVDSADHKHRNSSQLTQLIRKLPRKNAKLLSKIKVIKSNK